MILLIKVIQGFFLQSVERSDEKYELVNNEVVFTRVFDSLGVTRNIFSWFIQINHDNGCLSGDLLNPIQN